MSFFKKILGVKELTPEEQARIEQQKLAKQNLKERKQAELDAFKEKYIGTGFISGLEMSLYRATIDYFEMKILKPGECVLKSIKVEYDKTKKREIKGLLIATDQRLVFVSNGMGSGTYMEEYDYKKINGVAQGADGLLEKAFYLEMGRTRKKFDDIIPDKRFEEFGSIVLKQIELARNQPKPTRQVKPAKPVDKYAALEKLAKLKQTGVLTEEEFQQEKQKLLND